MVIYLIKVKFYAFTFYVSFRRHRSPLYLVTNSWMHFSIRIIALLPTVRF